MKIERAIGKPCKISEWFPGETGEILPFKGPKKFEYLKGIDNPATQMDTLTKMIDDALDLSWDSLFPGVDKSKKDELTIGFCVKLLPAIVEVNGLGSAFETKKAQELLKGDKVSSSTESLISGAENLKS